MKELLAIGLYLLLSWSTFSTFSTSSTSSGCGLEPPPGLHPGRSTDIKVVVQDPGIGEVERSFRLYLPSSYDINVPLPLVVDFHGWGGSGLDQELDSQFVNISNSDPHPFLVATPNGMNDQPGDGRGSFNCSRSDGPLGLPCDTNRTRYGEIRCYDSCPNCDASNSCDWTSCHDDVAFLRQIITYVQHNLCLDITSVHQSGISNGGMFSYFMASQLSDVIASIAPVAAASLIGFGEVPKHPINVIDIHGINDDVIPYDHAHAEGTGPHDSVISWDGYYYEPKQQLIQRWTTQLNCSSPQIWGTSMDGEEGWQCQIYSECTGGTEIVSCTADHGHDYPFVDINSSIEATRILWKFMKTHTKRLT